MITFEPFRAGHLKYFVPQTEQRDEYAALMASGQAPLLEQFVGLTAWRNSVCLGAAGMIPVRPHRAVGWLLLSNDAAPAMLAIARKVRRVFAASPYKRLEITVAASFENGHRFARLLGAVRETTVPMRYYGANEQDEHMYAMLKG